MSSSEDPLLRDESSSTGVPPLPISVVLQGNLTETDAFNDYKLVYFRNSMMSHCGHYGVDYFDPNPSVSCCLDLRGNPLLLPARASCEV